MASVAQDEGPRVSGVTVRVLPDGRMNCPSAAAYLGLSEKTLANLRCRGLGPKFCKRGRVFYFQRDLDEWLAAGLAQSTAQARVLAGVSSVPAAV